MKHVSRQITRESKNRFPIWRILFNEIQVEAYWTMQDQTLFRTCKQTNEGFIWGKKPVESEMPWRIMTSVTPVTNKIFWKELLPLQPNLCPYFKELLGLQISPNAHPQTPLSTNTSPQFTRECGNFKSTILDDPAWTKIMHVNIGLQHEHRTSWSSTVGPKLGHGSFDVSFASPGRWTTSIILDRQIYITASLPGSQVNIMNHRQVAWNNLWSIQTLTLLSCTYDIIFFNRGMSIQIVRGVHSAFLLEISSLLDLGGSCHAWISKNSSIFAVFT